MNQEKLEEKQPSVLVKTSWANSEFGSCLGCAVVIVAIAIFYYLIFK